MKGQQSAFLNLNADEDVGRRDSRKQQMALRHVRGGPEGDDEPQHDRVPDPAVLHALLEFHLGVFAPLEHQPCHHGVLDREQAQEHEVENHSLTYINHIVYISERFWL